MLSRRNGFHRRRMVRPGIGKSTAIREFLTKALSRGERVVIADIDGPYLCEFYDPAGGDVILNPFDDRSLRWALFAEIIRSYYAINSPSLWFPITKARTDTGAPALARC